jgi:hypothetical protein
VREAAVAPADGVLALAQVWVQESALALADGAPVLAQESVSAPADGALVWEQARALVRAVLEPVPV